MGAFAKSNSGISRNDAALGRSVTRFLLVFFIIPPFASGRFTRSYDSQVVVLDLNADDEQQALLRGYADRDVAPLAVLQVGREDNERIVEYRDCLFKRDPVLRAIARRLRGVPSESILHDKYCDTFIILGKHDLRRILLCMSDRRGADYVSNPARGRDHENIKK
jgi:hypothetical protein